MVKHNCLLFQYICVNLQSAAVHDWGQQQVRTVVWTEKGVPGGGGWRVLGKMLYHVELYLGPCSGGL